MSVAPKPRASTWRGISILAAPLVCLAALASFAYEANVEALVEARPFFVGVPFLTAIAGLVALRRPEASPIALFFALVTLALAVYGVATLSGAATAVSIVDRPAGMVAILAAAWTLTALVPSAPES
jgi:hypothetical protein